MGGYAVCVLCWGGFVFGLCLFLLLLVCVCLSFERLRARFVVLTCWVCLIVFTWLSGLGVFVATILLLLIVGVVCC